MFGNFDFGSILSSMAPQQILTMFNSLSPQHQQLIRDSIPQLNVQNNQSAPASSSEMLKSQKQASYKDYLQSAEGLASYERHERDFNKWFDAKNGTVTPPSNLELAQKYTEISEQLVAAQKEIETLKNQNANLSKIV